MASKRVRSKIVHKLWGKMASLGGQEIELEMDGLGHIYEVNKFNIIVRHEDHYRGPRRKIALDNLRKRLVDELLAEGWARQSERTDLVKDDARIQIDGPGEARDGVPMAMWVQVW